MKTLWHFSNFEFRILEDIFWKKGKLDCIAIIPVKYTFTKEEFFTSKEKKCHKLEICYLMIGSSQTRYMFDKSTVGLL